MKLNREIRRELYYVGAGLLIGTGLICLVYALLGRFDYTVVLGALLGSAVALLNLAMLGGAVQGLGDYKEQEKAAAQKKLQASYSLRMLLMALTVVLGFALPCFDGIAALVPFLLPQPILFVRKTLLSRPKAAQPKEGE